MRKLVKFFHQLGALGMLGGLIAYVLALLVAPDIREIEQHVALRASLATIANWLILPGMMLALVSGLLAMIAHYPFMNQPWVWAKALSGVVIFEATLASVDAPAEAARKAVVRAQAGEIDLATLERLVRDEWMAWYILIGLAVVNIALAVWRPRFGLRRAD